MSSSLRSGLALLILALLCVCAAVFGLGRSYHSFITPRTSLGELRGIAGDRWIQNGAEIRLENLTQRGNRLELKFRNWHPPGAPHAEFHVRVCGKSAAAFTAVPDSTQLVYLTGDCEPRRISFEVLNPLRASETDLRELGAQLNSAQVTSRIGVPIVSGGLSALAAGALFLLALPIWIVLHRQTGTAASSALPAALLVPLAGYELIGRSEHLNLLNPLALWLLLAFSAWGVAAGRRILQQPPAKQTGLSPLEGLILALCLCSAALLRLWGLDFGLPANFHPDEVPKYNAIMRMTAAGDLNPRYFLHPSLLLYSAYFMNNLLHALGLQGGWNETVVFAGRTASCLAGVLSVYFTFAIGRRLFSTTAGLAAAAVLAAAPLHVTCSRYVKEDALLVCVTLAAVALLLKAVQEDRKPLLLLAGLLAGCSAGVKYSGLLTAAVLCAAPWLRSGRLWPERSWLGVTALSLLLFPVGFLICTPYSVLDSATFISDFMHERNHMARGHTLTVDAWSQYWMYHFGRSILPGMTPLSALAGVFGVGLLLYRRRVEDLFVLALLLLFYLPAEWVKAKPAPQPERYILPCLQILALAAGELLSRLSQLRLSRFRLEIPLLAAAAAAIIMLPALRTIDLASELGGDTRLQMAAWMKNNLPAGSKVAIDWRPYAPSFPGGEFELMYLPRSRILPNLELKQLRSSGSDYLILSSLYYRRYFVQPGAEAAMREQIRQVFRRVPIVVEMAPRYGTYGFHNPTLTLFSLKDADFAALESERLQKQTGQIDATQDGLRASFGWGK